VDLGPLGGVGLTAYAGLRVIDALRGDETVWVSAAAGAVGSLAVQIAKLRRNRVIASAGTDHKVAWLRDALGVTAFNCRVGYLGAKLRELAPDGIDAYFDSVGGDHLEAALDHLTRRGRVAMCGSISEYESEPKGPRNLFMTVSKDLTLHRAAAIVAEATVRSTSVEEARPSSPVCTPGRGLNTRAERTDVPTQAAEMQWQRARKLPGLASAFP
jgi:NADPH-dependent curcumin reductase CurA